MKFLYRDMLAMALQWFLLLFSFNVYSAQSLLHVLDAVWFEERMQKRKWFENVLSVIEYKSLIAH